MVLSMSIKQYEKSNTGGTRNSIGYMEVLNNLFHNFPPTRDDIGTPGEIDLIYDKLKALYELHYNDKQLVTAYVNLLSVHLDVFDEFVYADYKLWHTRLKKFATSGLYGDAGINALKLYYKTMGNVLARTSTENNQQVFNVCIVFIDFI